jgi:hypothetical protein
VGEQPPWDPYGHQEPNEWQGQPSYGGQVPYRPQQPHGQQQPHPDHPPYQRVPAGQFNQRAQQYGQQPGPPSPNRGGHRIRPDRRKGAIPRRMLVILTGAALAVVGGGIALGLTLTSSSYPHAWCAETIQTLYGNGRTYGQFMYNLQFDENDGAPTGNIISDEQSLENDIQTANSSDVFNALSNLEAEQTVLQAVSSDAKQLNIACGLSGSYDSGKLNIPNSNES